MRETHTHTINDSSEKKQPPRVKGKAWSGKRGGSAWSRKCFWLRMETGPKTFQCNKKWFNSVQSVSKSQTKKVPTCLILTHYFRVGGPVPLLKRHFMAEKMPSF